MVGLQVSGLFGDPFGDEIVHRTGNVARRILLQTRDDQILFINNTPVIQPLFTVKDLHQGRFTGAVAPNQTDAFVIFDMQFSIIQQRRIAE
ncbi:Uncharacterised protein [Klebsiella aerogenes]|nr:Uncharacterised protein [Klebsiella aerogenes]